MKRHAVIGTILLATFMVPEGSFAAVQWKIADGGNGHFYELVLDTGTWTAANAAAEAMTLSGSQGHLATITSAAESTFILDNFGGNETWIGLTDEASEGNFVWVTGESLSFTRWKPGEPNNRDGIEHYVHIQSNTLWNDAANNDTQPTFLVEFDGPFDPQVPEPTALTVWSAFGGISLLGHRFHRRKRRRG